VPTKKVSKHWRQIDISERVEFFRTENTSLKIRISKLDLQSEDDKVRYGKDLLELKKAKETSATLYNGILKKTSELKNALLALERSDLVSML